MIKVITNEQLVMLIVLINSAVFIALDIDPTLPSKTGAWINWIDYFCVLFFVFELFAKLSLLGFKTYIKDNWNKFDLVIVLASIPILIEPFIGTLATMAWAPLFRLTRLLRLARFLRLSRILRYVQNVENLKKYQAPVYFLLFVIASNIIIKIFNWNFSWLDIYNQYYPSALIFSLTWLSSRLLNSFHTLVIQPAIQKRSEGGSEAAETIFITLIQVFVWAIGLTFTLEVAGHNSTSIIAGLGIGGMAVAFAAQDFIGNIIGGLLLYVQRPFELGEKISVAGNEGVVKRLGLRSITLEDFSGKVTSLPNRLLVSETIENITSSHFTKEVISMKLDLSMSASKLKMAANNIFLIAKKNEFVHKDFTVKFGKMDEYSHNIIFDYYLDKGKLLGSAPSEELVELITRENTKLYVEIVKMFQKNEILFANKLAR